MVRSYGRRFRREYINGLADETLTPERRQWIERYFAANAEVLEKLGVDPLPTEEQMPAAQQEECAREAAQGVVPQESDVVERIRDRFWNRPDVASPEPDQGGTEEDSSGDVLSVSIGFFMGVIHWRALVQVGWILSTQEPCLS